jgi:hypothetical protein
MERLAKRELVDGNSYNFFGYNLLFIKINKSQKAIGVIN